MRVNYRRAGQRCLFADVNVAKYTVYIIHLKIFDFYLSHGTDKDVCDN